MKRRIKICLLMFVVFTESSNACMSEIMIANAEIVTINKLYTKNIKSKLDSLHTALVSEENEIKRRAVDVDTVYKNDLLQSLNKLGITNLYDTTIEKYQRDVVLSKKTSRIRQYHEFLEEYKKMEKIRILNLKKDNNL